MKHFVRLVWGMLFLLHLTAQAQYMIVPVPPAPTFVFNDLWHFSLTRSTADNMDLFYVSLRVFEGNNQVLAKSNSSTFVLPVGTHYYNTSNLADLQPFTSSYYNTLLQQTVASGGTFPPGEYVFTYTLYGKADDGEFAPLCEESLAVTVETLWPPMLLSPGDGDTLQTIYPLLTWTPAFSSTFLGAIEYTLNLVEVLPGQNVYQAMQTNPVYLSQSNLNVTTLPYPSAAQALDTGKTYAWQVYAYAGGTSLGSSEVWRFTLVNENSSTNPQPIDSSNFYYELEYNHPQRWAFLRDKIIRFKYVDSYRQDSDSVAIIIYQDGIQEPFWTSTSQNLLFKSGQNYYTIDLRNNDAFTQGTYLLKITNSKNRSYYLKIIYRDEE